MGRTSFGFLPRGMLARKAISHLPLFIYLLTLISPSVFVNVYFVVKGSKLKSTVPKDKSKPNTTSREITPVKKY